MTPTPPRFHATVVALAIGQIVAWAALFYAYTSFVLPMRHSFGWSEPQTMGAFTLGLACWGCASYAVGAAIDRGRGRLVLSGGALLAAAGFWGWSQVQNLPMLYAAWALLGVSMAMLLYEPAFMVLAKKYPLRFRTGITALTLIGGFASTLSFPAVAWLIAALEWRDALRVIGVALLALAPLHAWALRGPAFAPAGIEPREGGPLKQQSAHAAANATIVAGADTSMSEALRTRTFWLLCAAFALIAFCVSAMWSHLMPALASKGLTPNAALAIAVWFGPAQVGGRLAHLLFGRRLYPHRLGVVVLACLPAALAIFALAQQTAALLGFALLFGLANGLLTILRGSLLPDYFGYAHIGRISGALATVSLFAMAGAPLATAALLVALGGYREMLLVVAGIGATGWCAYLLAGRPAPRALRQ